MPHQDQLAALVVEHHLRFALHLAHLLFYRRRFELLLDHIAQQDQFAAIRTKDLPLAAGTQRLVDLPLIAESLREAIALFVRTRVVPQPHHLHRVLRQVIVYVSQEHHSRVLVHIGFEIDFQKRSALRFPRQCESQLLSGLRFKIRRRFPKLRALERQRVMQSYYQRRVDLVRGPSKRYAAGRSGDPVVPYARVGK